MYADLALENAAIKDVLNRKPSASDSGRSRVLLREHQLPIQRLLRDEVLAHGVLPR
jgi:hypothetical protein